MFIKSNYDDQVFIVRDDCLLHLTVKNNYLTLASCEILRLSDINDITSTGANFMARMISPLNAVGKDPTSCCLKQLTGLV